MHTSFTLFCHYVCYSSSASFHRIHHMHVHHCQNNAHWRRVKKNPHLACAPPSWSGTGHGCIGTIWSYLPGEGRWVFPDNVGWKVGAGTGNGNDNEFGYAIVEQVESAT